MIMSALLQSYKRPLEAVTSFNYLGWVLTTSADEWPTVVNNLIWVRKKWARLYRILGDLHGGGGATHGPPAPSSSKWCR